MKLLYITNGINGIGGLERVLSIKASYFADIYHYDIHIITLNEPEKKTFYEFSSKIIIHRIQTQGEKLNYLKSYIVEINKVVSSVCPDIISVCDDGLKGLYVPLWIKKHEAALIYERHASMRLNNSKVQSLLMKLGGLMYDKVIVLTQYNLSEWLGNNQLVIPNPLSFYPNESASLLEKKIICVGSLSYNKGYDLLIDAWSKIAHKYSDWRIYIYGRGDSSAYETELRRKGILDSIIFCGSTPNIMKEMLNSSFLVLPSRSEGFGMVLIEAMACGLPCISFDCPCGPRDIIQNGKNGFLVEAENAYALSLAIEKMINNKALLKNMATFAKKSVKSYRIEQISLLWKELFNKLILK